MSRTEWSAMSNIVESHMRVRAKKSHLDFTSRDLLVTPKVQHHSGIRDCETQEQVFRVLSDKDAVKELKALYEFWQWSKERGGEEAEGKAAHDEVFFIVDYFNFCFPFSVTRTKSYCGIRLHWWAKISKTGEIKEVREDVWPCVLMTWPLTWWAAGRAVGQLNHKLGKLEH